MSLNKRCESVWDLVKSVERGKVIKPWQLSMPSSTTTIYSGNSHASATLGEVSGQHSPVTNILNRSNQTSGGVVDTPVTYHRPEEGALGPLESSGNRRGGAVHHHEVNYQAHSHTYIPPRPIAPIQTTLTRQTHGALSPTTRQHGSSPQLTRGANEPEPPQRGELNTGSTPGPSNTDHTVRATLRPEPPRRLN